MRRLTRAAAVTLLLATGVTTAPESSADQPALHLRTSAEYSANRDQTPCDEERWLRITPKEWTPRLVKGLIRCAVDRWDVPGGAPKAIAVFECESSLYPFAVGGDNLGIAQHKASLWVGRVNAYLRRDWFSRYTWRLLHRVPQGAFNARANVMVGIRMAHGPDGWDPWAMGVCA